MPTFFYIFVRKNKKLIIYINIGIFRKSGQKAKKWSFLEKMCAEWYGWRKMEIFEIIFTGYLIIAGVICLIMVFKNILNKIGDYMDQKGKCKKHGTDVRKEKNK